MLQYRLLQKREDFNCDDNRVDASESQETQRVINFWSHFGLVIKFVEITPTQSDVTVTEECEIN